MSKAIGGSYNPNTGEHGTIYSDGTTEWPDGRVEPAPLNWHAHVAEGKKMTDQLTRDQLLQQRLWAATNDCAAATKLLSALAENPPHAAESQEEHMRYVESALQSVRYNCGRLSAYIGKGETT